MARRAAVILADEFRIAMAHVCATTIHEVNPSLVRERVR
jgi:hypothetical protein